MRLISNSLGLGNERSIVIREALVQVEPTHSQYLTPPNQRRFISRSILPSPVVGRDLSVVVETIHTDLGLVEPNAWVTATEGESSTASASRVLVLDGGSRGEQTCCAKEAGDER